MDLKDTVKLMTSSNYKDRFRAEYLQTKERYLRLRYYCTCINDAKVLSSFGFELKEPKHDCPLELLEDQLMYMGKYLKALEYRAQFENINLKEEVTPEERLFNAIEEQDTFKKSLVNWFIEAGYKYMAYDDNGALYVFQTKPKLDDGVWCSEDDSYEDITIFAGLFPIPFGKLKDIKKGD